MLEEISNLCEEASVLPIKLDTSAGSVTSSVLGVNRK